MQLIRPRRSRSPLLALPLLTAVLAGCQNPATPAQPELTSAPARSTVVGRVYELQLQRDGQGRLAAAAIRTAGGPLGFQYVSSGTLNKDGQWFVRVTYRVTNNSTQPVSNLGFVPIDTDEDSDPATVAASAPTVGATFFKDVQFFDRSDASARASALSPVQARDVNGAVDAAATPYQPVDTRGVTLDMPTGLVLGSGGMSAKGWQTSGTLAPGASTEVTFATQMPAVSGTQDPFSYSVVFTAVNSVDVPVGIVPAAGLNPRVDLPSAGPAYVNGTLGDPTDPAATLGLKFNVAASDIDAQELSINATSSNPAVATTELSGTGATRTLRIKPQQVGYADITVTVTDGSRSASYVVKYAASQAAGVTDSTRFFSGASNASSAQDVGGGYMLVADDEFNTLNLYPAGASSVALKKFDFTSKLNLTDAANPEMDLEASARQGDRIYWLASHGNNKNGKLRTNRYRLFATDLSGTGEATTLSYVGRYDNLRSDLIAWDKANGSPLGLEASAAQGVIPEADGGVGFNIEGLAFRPGTTMAYLGFRAPLEPTGSRNTALIVPVTNFADLVTGAAGTASFGAPLQLDLGGRGIREMKCNDQGCLILAGPATGGSNFALYSWSGQPGDAAHLRNDLQSLAVSADGSFESVVNLPAGNPDTDALTGQALQLLTDNGDSVYYGDGNIAKDLGAPATNWQKFRAETVTVGAMPASTCTVSSVTVTPATSTLTVGDSQKFTANVSTSPAGCATTLSWSSSDSSVLSIDNTGQASALKAGVATVIVTVTPASGIGAQSATTVAVLPSQPTLPTTLPNVAVYRVGDGSAAPTNAGTAVFVDIYNPNDGSLVTTVPMPTKASGSNNPLMASGTASSEGLLSRSADGRYLVLTGYAAPVGTASIKGTSSTATPRVVARVDAAGAVDTTTKITDAYSGDNVRSAASADGSSFYVAGAKDGVRRYPLGGGAATSISTTPANLRQLNIFGGQLYTSSGAGTGTKGVLSVGTGLPTSTGQAATRLPGLSDTLTADSYGFFLADLDEVAGMDTLYVADGTSGLQKFSLNGGTWAPSGTVSGKFVGLTGVQQGKTVTLFTTDSGATQLMKLNDTSGYGGGLAGQATTIVSAKANTVLRGVALAPVN